MPLIGRHRLRGQAIVGIRDMNLIAAQADVMVVVELHHAQAPQYIERTGDALTRGADHIGHFLVGNANI